jgi:hypothetical protein
MKHLLTLLPLLLLAACGNHELSAATVCNQLAVEGVAKDCKADKPVGLGAAAIDRVTFTLPHGKMGQVLRFKKASDLEATAKAFDAAAILAGPYRYTSKSALIYVQLNSETDASVAAIAERVIGAL